MNYTDKIEEILVRGLGLEKNYSGGNNFSVYQTIEDVTLDGSYDLTKVISKLSSLLQESNRSLVGVVESQRCFNKEHAMWKEVLLMELKRHLSNGSVKSDGKEQG